MLTLSNIEKNYGDQVLFTGTGFQIQKGERIGLMGRNGSGKTTLFRLIAGEEYLDGGEIVSPKNYRIGILNQYINFTQDTVLKETALGLPASQADDLWIAEKTLSGLGFSDEDFHKHPDEFSGGFQVRINLAKVLISEPNLLLLDEPTNFLDIVSIRWLRKFFLNWKGEMLLITHDRSFMDYVCTSILAIHRRVFRKMQGNTAKLFEQIEIEEDVHEKTRENEARKRKKQEIFITRFRAKARMAGMVQSRVKALEKKTVQDKLEILENLEFNFRHHEFEAKYLLTCHNLCFKYSPEAPELIKDFSLNLANKECVAIIGKNGKGKSTLLKLLAKNLTYQSGNLKYHPLLKVGYYEQTNVNSLDPERTVVEEIMNSDPDHDRRRCRSICGAMMFEGDNALKKISILSGGEKSRVCLGKLLVNPTHLLLLDEPTNHLDAESCEALKNAIQNFAGTVIIVTHNEDFLHSLPQKLIVFDKNKHQVFESSYSEFLQDVGWESEETLLKKIGDSQGQSKSSHKKLEKRERAEKVKMRSQALKKIHKEMLKIESNISQSESQIMESQQQLDEAYMSNDGEVIGKMAKDHHELQEGLKKMYEQLEELMKEQEETEKRFSEL